MRYLNSKEEESDLKPSNESTSKMVYAILNETEGLKFFSNIQTLIETYSLTSGSQSRLFCYFLHALTICNIF